MYGLSVPAPHNRSFLELELARVYPAPAYRAVIFVVCLSILGVKHFPVENLVQLKKNHIYQIQNPEKKSDPANQINVNIIILLYPQVACFLFRHRTFIYILYENIHF